MPGLDGLKVADLTTADFEGRARMRAPVDFVRANFPGFENAFVVDFAPQTGVRQTRMLEGEYVVTKEDVMSRRHFADTVARGRDYYTPYRALLPRGVDQLLVAGRHYSATPQAQKIEPRDPALHGDGRGGRRRRRGGARRRHDGRKVDVAARCRTCFAPQGADPGDRPAANATRRWRPRNEQDSPSPSTASGSIDFTQVMLGPCCTQVLADYGADVIKIERPKAGDLSRWSIGSDPDGLNNPVFASLNRNKRSVALDMRTRTTKAGGAASWSTRADVVVNNFRARRHGAHGLRLRGSVGSSTRASSTPSAPASASKGPPPTRAARTCSPRLCPASCSAAPTRTHPIAIYPTALADYSAGMHLVQAILLALLQRGKTGRGQAVSLSPLQFHARHADAGSGDVDDARARSELGAPSL